MVSAEPPGLRRAPSRPPEHRGLPRRPAGGSLAASPPRPGAFRAGPSPGSCPEGLAEPPRASPVASSSAAAPVHGEDRAGNNGAGAAPRESPGRWTPQRRIRRGDRGGSRGPAERSLRSAGAPRGPAGCRAGPARPRGAAPRAEEPIQGARGSLCGAGQDGGPRRAVPRARRAGAAPPPSRPGARGPLLSPRPGPAPLIL